MEKMTFAGAAFPAITGLRQLHARHKGRAHSHLSTRRVANNLAAQTGSLTTSNGLRPRAAVRGYGLGHRHVEGGAVEHLANVE